MKRYEAYVSGQVWERKPELAHYRPHTGETGTMRIYENTAVIAMG